MIQEQKKRHVVSYENMSPELAEVFAEKYPKGSQDCLADVVKYTKPDGTPFYAVTIELPDSVYLVKIKVKTDDVDDIERWLDGEEDDGSDDNTSPSSDSSSELPDDNISQYSEDDSSEG